jgi:hypothetical protein
MDIRITRIKFQPFKNDKKIFIGGVLLLLIIFTMPVSAGEAVYDNDTQFDDLYVPGSSTEEKEMKNKWPFYAFGVIGICAEIGTLAFAIFVPL